MEKKEKYITFNQAIVVIIAFLLIIAALVVVLTEKDDLTREVCIKNDSGMIEINGSENYCTNYNCAIDNGQFRALAVCEVWQTN